MEGKATFTLARADSGRVIRQFTEHNLVTDAIRRLLSPPAYAIFKQFSWSDFMRSSLPIYKNLCGGIMLLGNTLEEKADSILLPPDTIPVATAGDPYSGTLETRGTLNSNETYAMGNGYHFTWDFGTDKANGTIKSVALTSRMFGNSGFAAADSAGSMFMDPVTKNAGNMYIQIIRGEGQYLCTPEKCMHVYLRKTDSSNMVFTKIKSLDMTAVGVTDCVDFSVAAEPVKTIRVELPIEVDPVIKVFVDSFDRKVYFFGKAVQEDNERLRLDYATVDLDSFAVSAKRSWVMNSAKFTVCAAAIHGGRLYAASNKALLAFSSAGNLSESWEGVSGSGMWFYTVNGVLRYYTTDRKTHSLYNGKWYGIYGCGDIGLGFSADIKPPYFPAHIMNQYLSEIQGGVQDPYLITAADYLATVNNLSEPLVKTSEHTLKITYDITN